jgi:hypothetical protein
MKTRSYVRVPAGVAVAFATAALTAPTAMPYPLDPEDGRLVVPMTSRTETASAKPKAKPAKRTLAPRPKPALEP